MDKLFLMKKGLKARKKRLAGGGGGGGGLIGIKPIAMTSKNHPSVPNNYSSAEMTVEDITNGGPYVDPITSVAFMFQPVADMVAHQNGLVSSPALTNGTLALTAGNEYRIEVYAYLHHSVLGSGVESAGIAPLTDVGSNWSNGHINCNPLLGQLPSPYRAPYGLGFIFTVSANAVAGESIIQIANPNGGADTNSNVIAGTASPSDAFHFKITLS
tara:strand:+ start:701 stop:1342 length:642 start_codon:yes stop_codon:yes gene_type:complete